MFHAIIADSHFEERTRFAECKRIHSWIAQDARARGCTSFSHSGDVYEGRSSPAERLAVADWVDEMRELVGPGVIVKGNHDPAGDLLLLERLDKRPVTVVEDARQVVLSADGVDLVVSCLAWPERSRVTALAQARFDAEATAHNALQAILRGFGVMHDGTGPHMLLAHAMVRGSRVSTGQPLVGCDFEIGIEDLAMVRADFLALGHVHMGQNWDIGGAPAVYPGSPRRKTFGEMETKYYVIAEFSDRGLVGWERIETPCTSMLHVPATWDGDLVVDDVDVKGAEVRLRYAVPSDQRDAAAVRAAEWEQWALSAGAVLVQVEEEVLSNTRVRTPEIARAELLTDKLDAYWASKSIDVAERRGALHQKTRELEAELRQLSDSETATREVQTLPKAS